MRLARGCLLLCALTACTNDYDILPAPTATGGGPTTSSGSGAAGGSGGAAAGSGPGAAGGAATSSATASGGAGGGQHEVPMPIYFTSKRLLWQYLPVTKERAFVLEYNDDCDDITDIAVDATGKFYASSFSGDLYLVDPDGTCHELYTEGNGYYTDSLGYLPAGINGGEALVAYDNANYVRIDLGTGKKSNVGALGQGYPLGLDVVIVDDARGWVIVGAGGDCDQHCLVRIEPLTGEATSPALTFGISEMYGLAWSMGTAYGFHFDGRVFEVDLVTSNILEVPKPDGENYGDGVWGAASPPAPMAAR